MVLRPGNAGSNTAADHLTVLDRALAQIPDRWRSKPILIRADGAGYSHARIAALAEQQLQFSVGYPVTDAVRDAISLVPTWAWPAANNADGRLREHADVIEVTQLLDLSRWTSSCPAMRVIVRRELPHPGATLDAFEIRDDRYQAFTTNTARGQLAFLPSPASCVRPGPGPDPRREGHRHRPPTLQAHPDQQRVGRAGADRRGPPRPGPDDAAQTNPSCTGPNSKRCTTACCTPPPGSPEANAKCSYPSPSTGRGPSPSPGLSNDCGRPAPGLTGHHHQDPASLTNTETPDTAPALHPAPTRNQTPSRSTTSSQVAPGTPGLVPDVGCVGAADAPSHRKNRRCRSSILVHGKGACWVSRVRARHGFRSGA